MDKPATSTRPRPICGCQLKDGGAGGREPWTWYVWRQGRRAARALCGTPWYVVRRSRGLQRRLGRLLRRLHGQEIEAVTNRWTSSATSATVSAAVRTLAPGDLVRVRSREEIQRTLDIRGRCKGCPFPKQMYEFCGREFRVFKRVERFYDEARRRLVTCRNVVQLEGVFCDGSGYPEIHECHRSCFFFWRIEWLQWVGTTRPFEIATQVADFRRAD